jgi:hypothetical protein
MPKGRKPVRKEEIVLRALQPYEVHRVLRDTLFTKLYFDRFNTVPNLSVPIEDDKRRRRKCIRELKEIGIIDPSCYYHDSRVRYTPESWKIAKRMYEFGLDILQTADEKRLKNWRFQWSEHDKFTNVLKEEDSFIDLDKIGYSFSWAGSIVDGVNWTVLSNYALNQIVTGKMEVKYIGDDAGNTKVISKEIQEALKANSVDKKAKEAMRDYRTWEKWFDGPVSLESSRWQDPNLVSIKGNAYIDNTADPENIVTTIQLKIQEVNDGIKALTDLKEKLNELTDSDFWESKLKEYQEFCQTSSEEKTSLDVSTYQLSKIR